MAREQRIEAWECAHRATIGALFMAGLIVCK